MGPWPSSSATPRRGPTSSGSVSSARTPGRSPMLISFSRFRCCARARRHDGTVEACLPARRSDSSCNQRPVRRRDSTRAPAPPMGLGSSIALFGTAAVLLLLTLRIVIPALRRVTHAEPVLLWFAAASVCLFTPLVLVAAWLLHRERRTQRDRGVDREAAPRSHGASGLDMDAGRSRHGGAPIGRSRCRASCAAETTPASIPLSWP